MPSLSRTVIWRKISNGVLIVGKLLITPILLSLPLGYL
jgi:hypothetical protein